MKAAHTDDTNLTLGESQGYLGLPVKAASYDDGTIYMESQWVLEGDELERLKKGGRVVVTVLTTQHPPIKLEVTDE